MAINRKQITIPCIECICKAVCRHKSYTLLFSQCNLIRNSLSNDSIYKRKENITKIEQVLNPTVWSLEGEVIHHHTTNQKIKEITFWLEEENK